MMRDKQRHPVTPVASGSYVVSRARNEYLVAYLGTCVGVTLTDPQANVGGLIHLLLPESTTSEDPWHPVAYAATGLPIFIGELCAAGALKERLEACIAGGSLVGPLSGRDLILDIGGRTVEVVERILHREGIAIRKSETGGHFTCLLSLNLKTWESSVEPIGSGSVASTRTEAPVLSQNQLDKAIEQVLPIPQIALKLIRMVNDRTSTFKEVAKEVVKDQVISARVLKLCNSVSLARTSRIDSIDKALMMVGDKHLVQIVLATAFEDFLSGPEGGYSLCKGGLFKHALGTASISQYLAELTDKASPDLAYTAGLLHDIGKVILDQYVSGLFPLFYRKTQVETTALIAVENELFGISHTESGKRLAQRWHFPDNLADVIRHHHFPEMAATDPELCHIVYLADLIMSRFVVGQELEGIGTSRLETTFKKLGLGLDHFPLIIEKVCEEVSCMPSALQR